MKRKLLDWETWMDEVNRYLEERHDVHSLDIDDWRYRDDFDDGLSPMQSARRALRNAGWQ
jgi:hypothetical protein